MSSVPTSLVSKGLTEEVKEEIKEEEEPIENNQNEEMKEPLIKTKEAALNSTQTQKSLTRVKSNRRSSN